MKLAFRRDLVCPRMRDDLTDLYHRWRNEG